VAYISGRGPKEVLAESEPPVSAKSIGPEGSGNEKTVRDAKATIEVKKGCSACKEKEKQHLKKCQKVIVSTATNGVPETGLWRRT